MTLFIFSVARHLFNLLVSNYFSDTFNKRFVFRSAGKKTQNDKCLLGKSCKGKTKAIKNRKLIIAVFFHVRIQRSHLHISITTLFQRGSQNLFSNLKHWQFLVSHCVAVRAELRSNNQSAAWILELC